MTALAFLGGLGVDISVIQTAPVFTLFWQGPLEDDLVKNLIL
jgi:hypothetical protein